jgi:hypothetical protein
MTNDSLDPEGLQEQFYAIVGPPMTVLRELVDVADTAPDRFGHLPAADSVATRELAVQAAEKHGSRSTWLEPLTDTHSIGSFTLRATSDNIRTFACAILSKPTPVYAHLVLARSAMQGCVISHWLNDPSLDPLERIKRGLIEQLHSSRELHKVKALRPHTIDRRQEWKDVAEAFGWPVSGNKHPAEVDGQTRPSIPGSFSVLLVDDAEVNLGNTIWSYLSSVDHMTLYGLLQSFDRHRTEVSPLLPQVASFGTSSDSVTTYAICLLRMFGAAADARFNLMGWSWPEWLEARRRAASMERQLMEAKIAR